MTPDEKAKHDKIMKLKDYAMTIPLKEKNMLNGIIENHEDYEESGFSGRGRPPKFRDDGERLASIRKSKRLYYYNNREKINNDNKEYQRRVRNENKTKEKEAKN
jgi:hypothetical protein